MSFEANPRWGVNETKKSLSRAALNRTKQDSNHLVEIVAWEVELRSPLRKNSQLNYILSWL
jgi:hypothetical protein